MAAKLEHHPEYETINNHRNSQDGTDQERIHDQPALHKKTDHILHLNLKNNRLTVTNSSF